MMKAHNTRKNGGLILNAFEIKALLSEPDTRGLAFGFDKKGCSKNVDLKVLRVVRLADNLFGEERTLKYKAGAGGLEEQVGNLDDFKFEFSTKAEEDNFDFGYIDKEVLWEILEDDEEELFISGAKSHYGNLNQITGEWFTFVITPRRFVMNESNHGEYQFLSSPHKTRHILGCPPVWMATPIRLAANDKNYTISFKRKIFPIIKAIT